jgi:hypothetical protein
VATIGRLAHLLSAWLFAIGVIVQGFLAGIGLPQLGGKGDFGAHIAVGYTIMGLLAVAIPLTGALGRVPRRQIAFSIGLLILYVIQTSLPYLRTSSPTLAALHPANAMLLLLVAIYIGWRANVIASDRRPTTPTPAVEEGDRPV